MGNAICATVAFGQLSGTDSAHSFLMYNNQTNTYAAGKKQIFQSNDNSVTGGMAGLNLAAVGSNPQTLGTGDVWFRSHLNHVPVAANLNVSGGTGSFSGLVTAGSFSGDGAALTNLNASNIASGTLNDARLASDVVLTSKANTYTAGEKQTFVGNDSSVSGGKAGLNIAAASGNPQTLATGDLCLTTGDAHAFFEDNCSTAQKLAV